MEKKTTDEIFEQNTLDDILDAMVLKEKITQYHEPDFYLKKAEDSKTGIRTKDNYFVIGYCTIDLDEQGENKEVKARPGPLLTNITLFNPENLKGQIKDMIQDAEIKPVRILYAKFEPDVDRFRPTYNELINEVIPAIKENKTEFRKHLAYDDLKLTNPLTAYLNTKILDK